MNQMVSTTQPHKDPTLASPDKLDSSYKRCSECCAYLPVEAFSITKYETDGYRKVCRACRSQALRLHRRDKYRSKSQVDDSIIRNVRIQNTKLISLVASTTIEVAGFDYVRGIEYKIFFGKSEKTGLSSMTIFNLNGSEYLEMSYSGFKNIETDIYAVLKNHNIRLELNLADVRMVKQLIYFL